MSKNYPKEVVFMLSKDEILACAKELKIPQKKVTDNVVELVKSRLDREFDYWPAVIKDVLNQTTKCPLDMVCFPSCSWWKEGRCTFPREA